MKQLFLLCAFVPLLYRLTNAFPSGAPEGTCKSMAPNVQRHGAQPQNTMAPYVIQVDKAYYSQNSTVKVYIKVCENTEIRGFLIEAREVGEETPLGNFSMIPQNTKHLDCTSINAETALAAVTHSQRLTENNMLSFEWQPTAMTTGNISFVATIAKDRMTYWLGVRSIVLQEMTPGMMYANPNNPECPMPSVSPSPSGMENTKTGNGAIFASNVVLLLLAILSASLFI